ncbi:hypothetical protein [Pedobacter alluvionis]|uniref:Uncharacterized protein n=1 Tax=Pedobacter alluvionis TaxID=475253 RepID=A0A497Y5G0_9SPHI|nr:hypothetical protein [Pedobacter alluvionis]RLJ77025.1 hypothetical protein BCL90_2087 [Pedobacter alluvionis]TFB33729.1 hypothetical protein E3V97_06700 [Pedobacter alluvionis]
MEKVNLQKIIISTLLKVLLMIVVIIILNSWPNIKQSFSGNIPPLNYWLDHSFKISNIILILGFGGYFYYKDLTDQKQLMEKSKNTSQH